MAQARQKRSVDADGATTVRGKNANGEGSVYRATVKRGGVEKVRWEAVRTLPGGRRIKRTGSTQAEARSRLEQAIAELDAASSRRLGPNPTVAALIGYYLDNVAASRNVAATTLETYRKMAAAVTQIAGTWPVRELQKPDAQKLVNELGVYSDHFARGCRRVARNALNEAIDLGYLTSNPIDRVQLPMPKDRKVRRTLTVDQQRALVTEAIRFEPSSAGKAPAPLYRHGVAVTLRLHRLVRAPLRRRPGTPVSTPGSFGEVEDDAPAELREAVRADYLADLDERLTRRELAGAP